MASCRTVVLCCDLVASCYCFGMSDQNPIKELIAVAGSQKKLAEILGVPEERVSRWVNGHHRTPGTIAVIAELIDQLPRKDWPERWRT